MPFRAKADWSEVDWSLSDRDIAARLGVSHSAVAKRRKKQGHFSEYKVDAVLLRGWFECNRRRLPRMSDEDIQVEVFDAVDIIIEKSQVCYWRKLMNPKAHATKAKPESVAGV